MQAHSDSLVLAAPALGAAFPADLDPSDIEIGHRDIHLGALIALGFAMTLLSAGLAFGLWGDLGGYEPLLGCAGVMLFGIATCRIVWMLPAERGAVVVINRHGIRDLRIGNEFLLWDSIEQVSVGERRRRPVVVLTFTPAFQRQCAGSVDAQADAVVVSPDGLATDLETLLRNCQTYHRASERRSAADASS